MNKNKFMQIKNLHDMREFLGISYRDKSNKDKKSDNIKVSCAQENGYDELKDKYEKYYKAYPEYIFAKAACLFCLQKRTLVAEHLGEDAETQWGVFYDYLSEELGIEKNNKDNDFDGISMNLFLTGVFELIND